MSLSSWMKKIYWQALFLENRLLSLHQTFKGLLSLFIHCYSYKYIAPKLTYQTRLKSHEYVWSCRRTWGPVGTSLWDSLQFYSYKSYVLKILPWSFSRSIFYHIFHILLHFILHQLISITNLKSGIFLFWTLTNICIIHMLLHCIHLTGYLDGETVSFGDKRCGL